MVNCSLSLWGNTSPRRTSTVRFSTEKLRNRVIAALPASETSLNNIILKCWGKQTATTTANGIANQKPNCPFNGESLTECLLYKATSATSNNSFVYSGTSEVKFKTRYNNHRKLFKFRECMNETKLSKHVWNLNNHGFDKSLSWEIHKEASP